MNITQITRYTRSRSVRFIIKNKGKKPSILPERINSKRSINAILRKILYERRSRNSDRPLHFEIMHDSVKCEKRGCWVNLFYLVMYLLILLQKFPGNEAVTRRITSFCSNRITMNLRFFNVWIMNFFLRGSILVFDIS